MKDEDLLALDKSIKKWEDIYDNDGEDKGVDNCALCEIYYNNKCKSCPVYVYTGKASCKASPYQDWVDLWWKNMAKNLKYYPSIKSFGEYSKEAELICKKEIDFLREVKKWVEKQ